MSTEQRQRADPQHVSLGWFHRYPARFAIDTVEAMLDMADQALRHDGLVLDPFAGSGSTMAAARQRGIRSLGVELTTLGVLIAQVRLNPPQDLDAALHRAETWASAQTGKPRPLPDGRLTGWLGEDNAAALSVMLRKLRRLRDPAQRRWLAVALSAALRPASVWLPGSIKPQIDPDRSPPPIQSQFRKAARALYRDSKLETGNADTFGAVIKGDARQLPLPDKEVDAIITSPPYWTMYDYFDVQRLTYLAFGWPQDRHQQIGRSSGISPDGVRFSPPQAMRRWYQSDFGGENTIDGRALRAYLVDMRSHAREAFRVLRPGGIAVYAVADTDRRGRRFALVKAVRQLLRESGFEDIRTHNRSTSHRRILPAGRDPETGRFTGGPAQRDAIAERFVVAQRPVFRVR